MFLSLQSPQGGRKLNWLGFGERVPENIIIKQDTGERVVLQDYYCLVAGYAVKELRRGERIYWKYSEAKEVYELLRDEFGK